MKKPTPPDLQTLIINELKANRSDLPRLSKLSGVPYRWIRAVASGQISAPNFRRTVKIARFLGIRVMWEPCQHFNRFEDPGEFVPTVRVSSPRDGS